MSKKSIFCFGAKRSGTTAIHQIFVKHPEVNIIHPNPNIDNFEPNFWNYAAAALHEDFNQLADSSKEKGWTPKQQFDFQVSTILPDVPPPNQLSKEMIFQLWETIISRYSPWVFDKSPKYLASPEGLNLLLEYSDLEDVRVFGIVRDPRDVISSQHEQWFKVAPQYDIKHREEQWVSYYKRFEEFKRSMKERSKDVPLIIYENLVKDPKYWVSQIFEHCGISYVKKAYKHLKPVSIGRFRRSKDKEIRGWEISDGMKQIGAKYGYRIE